MSRPFRNIHLSTHINTTKENVTTFVFFNRQDTCGRWGLTNTIGKRGTESFALQTETRKKIIMIIHGIDLFWSFFWVFLRRLGVWTEGRDLGEFFLPFSIVSFLSFLLFFSW